MTRHTLHALGAPAGFLVLALVPLFDAPYAVRASLGLLVWMSWWWIARPVHLAVTALLPPVVVALFGVLPAVAVLPAYAEPLVFLLLGANMLATLWRRWGLDRRIALLSLLGVGTDTRRQILVWFAAAALLSAVLPNTVVAASLMPVVVAMLRFIGVDTIAASRFGTAVLLAVAWGTSVGGAGTPLGGAPNLLTIQFLERRVIDHEFLFTTWVARLLPLTLAIGAAAAAYMRWAFRPELERVDGTRTYFAGELHALGPMSGPERWGVVLFSGAALLAFTRELYAAHLPGLTPPIAFLGCGLLAFAGRHRGAALLDWEYAQAHMMWGLIYLFAGGSALGQVLSETGTARFVADRLVPLAGGAGLAAVAVFAFLAILLTQITSNTAAAAIVVPVTISTFAGLGMNPIPFVYIVAAAANYGLMLPSSSAGPALAAGYGVDLRVMFWQGARLAALIWLLVTAAGFLLARFWPAFGVA